MQLTPTMATSVRMITGVETMPTSWPRLVRVIVEPVSSARARLQARARWARRATSAAQGLEFTDVDCLNAGDVRHAASGTLHPLRALAAQACQLAVAGRACESGLHDAARGAAAGDRISTVALSVITSASAWSSATSSPGFTCQATGSNSVVPSPRSGTLTTCTPISRFHHAAQCRGHARRPGEIGPIQRVRVGRVPAGHALDRGLELVEAMVVNSASGRWLCVWPP